jgi:putative ABC transport system ATP-binding protein
MKVLQELNNQGITIVLVTHETDIAEYSRRIITLRDGLKIEDKIVEIPRKAADDLKTLKAPQFMENGNGSDMEVRAE